MGLPGLGLLKSWKKYGLSFRLHGLPTLLALDAVLAPLLLDPLLDPGGVFLLSLTLQTLETLPRVPPTAWAWTWSLRLKRLDRINKILGFRASHLNSISDRNPILLK